MMNSKKLKVLNQCTFSLDYEELIKASKETRTREVIDYYGSKGEGHDLLFGISPDTCRDYSGKLICDCEDLLYHTPGKRIDERGRKQLLAIEFCLNNYDFNYLYITAPSSYVEYDKLEGMVERLPTSGVYCGNKSGDHIREVRRDVHFVDDSSLILSRDVARIVVQNKELYYNLHKKYPFPVFNHDLRMGMLLLQELKCIDYKAQPRFPIVFCFETDIEDLEIERREDLFNYKVAKNQANKIYKLHELKNAGSVS